MLRRLLAISALLLLSHAPIVHAEVVTTSGTMVVEPSPHAAPADDTIFVFVEQTDVPFVSTQPLQLGSIAPGTLVDSHYVQFDPVSATGLVGTGSVTFDGPILGVVTATASLTASLSPEASGTSDSYFGLETTLGPYPTGAVASARGLGSPEDDLVVPLGSTVLTVDSLEIPSGGAGNLDGFRVFTASQPTPVPTHVPIALLFAALVVCGGSLTARRRLVSV